VPSLKPLIEIKQRMAAQQGKRWKPKKMARAQYPIALEIAYRKKLVDMVKYLNRLIEERLFSKLPSIIAQAKSIRSDAYTDTITSIVQTIKDEYGNQYSDDYIRGLASAQANQVSNFQRNQLTRILSNSLGVDIFLSEPYLKTEADAFVKKNVELITSLPMDQLKDVDNVVMNAIRSGQPVAETEALIKKQWGDSLKDKPVNRAELIARDQSGKLFGQLNQLRQTELGLEQYTWRGVLDDRERESHRENEGQVFSWNKPPSQTGHPGQDYQCRCIAEPVLTGLMMEAEPEPVTLPPIITPPPAPVPAPAPEPITAPAPAPIPTPAPLPLPKGISPAPAPVKKLRTVKPKAQPTPTGQLTPEAKKLFSNFSMETQKGPTSDKIRVAMNAIAKVLKTGLNFEKIPVKLVNSARFFGRLTVRSGFDSSVGKFVDKYDAIKINRVGPHPAMTFAHEFGHYIDFAMNRKHRGHLSSFFATHSTPEAQTLKSAITGTPEFRIWNDVGYSGNKEHGLSFKHARYLKSDVETFARSFAQYVAEESGDEVMKSELAASLVSPDTSKQQWTTETFMEIKKAMKRFLETEG
jgi:SPP1 gp7 family putative phage head morphogenesis protein